jgi:tRNA(Arg) A34 adenosine deaminase TadA
VLKSQTVMSRLAWTIPVPDFVDPLAAEAGRLTDDDSGIRLAIALSRENMLRGGGPFGAVIAREAQIVAAGVNCVLEAGLSIAHAEIVAMMRAQQTLRDQPENAGPLTLYASTEPCCQCFGALFWSGMTRLVCAATSADAEAIGFDEGPKPEDWPSELERRGWTVARELQREDARAVLQQYAARGGMIYSPVPRRP